MQNLNLIDYIKPNTKTDFNPEFEYLVGDSMNLLKNYEDSKFDLIITSPPYNVGKEYEVKKSIEDYLSTQEKLIIELVRVLSYNGNICVERNIKIAA